MDKATAPIDKQWFLDNLERKERTQAGLARHLGVDRSAVFRIFSGERKMTMKEANQIAQFMNMDVRDVLKHAGIRIGEDGKPISEPASDRILLAATINDTGKVEKLLEPVQLPQSVLNRAQAAITIHGRGDSKVIAAQVRALKGPLSILDDAVLLFGHTETVENDAIGVLSICRNRQGEQLLAKIDRARKTGEARLILFDGKVVEFTLHTATPILAIIP